MVGFWPLPTTIGLGRKGFPGTNVLAFNQHLLITDVKSFTALDPVETHSGGLHKQILVQAKCLNNDKHSSLFVRCLNDRNVYNVDIDANVIRRFTAVFYDFFVIS
jgi:hypothetical protein